MPHITKSENFLCILDKSEKCCRRAGQLYDIVNNQIAFSSLDLFSKLLELSTFEYGYREVKDFLSLKQTLTC